MVILVDMDDTIEHLLVPWLDWLNRKYGRNVRKSDVHSWDMRIAYPGLMLEEIFGALDEEEFWDTVPPIEGAAEVLERWMKQGHQVYIVTATPPRSVRAKMERVLFRYFPFLSWDQVIITSNKQLLKADVMVDDGYHNLVGGDYRKVLVDAPYNREFDEKKDGMIRVHNWKEIEEAVASFADNPKEEPKGND